MTTRGLPLYERFQQKVSRDPDGCWLWTGYIDPAGYARFRSPGEVRAHRYSYTHHVGPILTGLVIDHICRVRHCVNPDHLRVLTSGENTRAPGSEAPSARLRAALACVNGHPFTAENTRYNAKGYRSCRTCTTEANRRTRSRKPPPLCPEGHTKQKHPTSDRHYFCPTCRAEQPSRERTPRVKPPTFECGHARATHGAPNRTGGQYCATCRVERRQRDECHNGHSFRDPANLYVSPGGHRQCRVCAQARATTRTTVTR
jgi:hypothetical protein